MVGKSFIDYMTVKEFAQEWGVTTRLITIHINAGRIPGAIKTGNMWLIPKDAVKPADMRRKDNKPPL